MKSKKNKAPAQARDDRKRNDARNKEVTNERDGEKLPGEYPPKEDIMNRMNTRRVGMDVENFSRAIGAENLNINEPVVNGPGGNEEDPLFLIRDVEDRLDNGSMQHPIPKDIDQLDADGQERNESDVTGEDLQALGPKDLSMDMGEDEQLKNRVWPVDMAGEDLDVPGAELDDANEAVGSEDEENNSYSLGGDAHEDNLEGK